MKSARVWVLTRASSSSDDEIGLHLLDLLEGRLLHLLRGVAGVGDRVDDEEVRILAPREAVQGTGGERALLFLDHSLVEARGAALAQDLRQHGQRRVVRVVLGGTVEAHTEDRLRVALERRSAADRSAPARR